MYLKLTQKSAVTTHHYQFPIAEEPLFKTGQHIKPLGSGSQKNKLPLGSHAGCLKHSLGRDHV